MMELDKSVCCCWANFIFLYFYFAAVNLNLRELNNEKPEHNQLHQTNDRVGQFVVIIVVIVGSDFVIRFRRGPLYLYLIISNIFQLALRAGR